MCGLVGVVGQIGLKEEEVFKDLLAVDVLRGAHSTGIVSVSPRGEVDWAKAAMLPQDFMQTRHFKQAFAGSHVLLMGHNRYATKGSINTANAHPFEIGDIVGMHNGTLINWYATLDDANKFDVDSECLIHTINNRGLKDSLAGLNGAFALTWHDKKDNTFNIIRNDQRTLYTRWSKDKRTMYYASEAWMIPACVQRRGLELDPQTYSVSPGKHMSWVLPDKTMMGLPKGRSSKVPLYVPPPAPAYPDYGRGYQGRGAAGGNRLPSPPPLAGVAREYADLVGKTVNFYCTEVDETEPGEGVIVRGMTVDKPHHPVSCRCSKAEGDKMFSWIGEMTGRVSSYLAPFWSKGVQEPGYISIQASTVSYVEDAGEDQYVVLGPRDKIIDKDEFDKLTTGGCSFCSCNLIYGLDDVEWEGDSPLCVECYEELTNPAVGNVVNLRGNK